jgi:alkane 1-monooxygenase
MHAPTPTILPPSPVAAAIKKYGYLLFFSIPALPFIAWWMSSRGGSWEAWVWLVPFQYFVFIPVVDWLIGADSRNPSPGQEEDMLSERYYTALLLLCVPLQLAVVVFGAWVFATADMPVWARLVWAVSIGFIGGVQAINTAHELIHKNKRLQQWSGGLLLSMVGYASFKFEHIYRHHVHVSTPLDNSSAPLGQSVYAFLFKAYRDNLPAAFRLERAQRQRLNKPLQWWRFELTAWYGITLAIAAVLTLVWGWAALIYFVIQCVMAVFLLEVVNYIEHYGLQRNKLPDGRYERVDVRHSWNANFLLTNWVLFQLQRHSDHHAHAARPYQCLRHFDSSPQLPFGYATMILLAVVPPLWRAVMDPRVLAHRAQHVPS